MSKNKKFLFLFNGMILLLSIVNIAIMLMINIDRKDYWNLYQLVSDDGTQSVLVEKKYNSSTNTKYCVTIRDMVKQKTFWFSLNDYSKDCFARFEEDRVYLCIDSDKGLKYYFEWGNEDEN